VLGKQETCLLISDWRQSCARNCTGLIRFLGAYAPCSTSLHSLLYDTKDRVPNTENRISKRRLPSSRSVCTELPRGKDLLILSLFPQ